MKKSTNSILSDETTSEAIAPNRGYAKLVHGSLFSGIGGFDLAADWMGWENAFHCEWNSFGQKILKYYWPKATSYEDITKTDFSIWRGRIDVLTGGFPCQPYSVAGKRKGKEDERHLWPEMLRAIREIQPQWVVGENVLGITNWNGGLVFDEVQADLEAQGYEVQPYVLPACAVNAPHRRDRVWFVAYKDTNKDGRGSFQRKEKTEKWRQRDVSSGDNERIRTNNGQVGIATDPSSFGYRGWNIEAGTDNTEKRALDKNIQQYGDGVRSEAEGCSEFATEKYFTNSECKRLQGCKRKGSTIEEKEQRRQSSNHYIKYNASNSECGRGREVLHDVQREKPNGQVINSFDEQNDWSEFPTQSPVCSGDDGLPTELDGITFSKWRANSVSAYGNAIVPQVAIQIFKAINLHTTQT